MFHKYSDDDVDEYELWDENKDDEVDWSDDRVNTAVVYAVRRWVTVVSQRVLEPPQNNVTSHSVNCKATTCEATGK